MATNKSNRRRSNVTGESIDPIIRSIINTSDNDTDQMGKLILYMFGEPSYSTGYVESVFGRKGQEQTEHVEAKLIDVSPTYAELLSRAAELKSEAKGATELQRIELETINRRRAAVRMKYKRALLGCYLLKKSHATNVVFVQSRHTINAVMDEIAKDGAVTRGVPQGVSPTKLVARGQAMYNKAMGKSRAGRGNELSTKIGSDEGRAKAFELLSVYVNKATADEVFYSETVGPKANAMFDAMFAALFASDGTVDLVDVAERAKAAGLGTFVSGTVPINSEAELAAIRAKASKPAKATKKPAKAKAKPVTAKSVMADKAKASVNAEAPANA